MNPNFRGRKPPVQDEREGKGPATEGKRPEGLRRDPAEMRGAEVEAVLRRAVTGAVAAHARAGRAVAVWRDGKVSLIPAEKIEARAVSEAEKKAEKKAD